MAILSDHTRDHVIIDGVREAMVSILAWMLWMSKTAAAPVLGESMKLAWVALPLQDASTELDAQ